MTNDECENFLRMFQHEIPFAWSLIGGGYLNRDRDPRRESGIVAMTPNITQRLEKLFRLAKSDNEPIRLAHTQR
jgi:hypothetical protein